MSFPSDLDRSAPVSEGAARTVRYGFRIEIEAKDYPEAIWTTDQLRRTLRGAGISGTITPMNGTDPLPRERVGIEVPRRRRLKLNHQ
jgi:hypothetical protein